MVRVRLPVNAARPFLEFFFNFMSEQLALAITEYLSDCIKTQKVKGEGAESLEVAIQAINEAFGIDLDNSDQIKKLSIAPTSLASIFEIYLKTKGQMKKVR